MFEDLLAANRRYAEESPPSQLTATAARHFCLLTCMDTRIDPLPVLGLVRGDAKVLRNAGARVTPDVLRSLVLAAAYLEVRYVAVMQHTRCALAGRTDEELRAGLGEPRAAAVAGWDLGAMTDPDRSLVADVAAIRTCPGMAEGLAVEGWRYDVDSGRVHRVVTE